MLANMSAVMQGTPNSHGLDVLPTAVFLEELTQESDELTTFAQVQKTEK